MTVVPCIVCKKQLEQMDSGSENHADDANEFRAVGQYGSTVFDPMDGSYVAVNVCDGCLKSAGRSGMVLTGQHGGQPSRPWTPRRSK